MKNFNRPWPTNVGSGETPNSHWASIKKPWNSHSGNSSSGEVEKNKFNVLKNFLWFLISCSLLRVRSRIFHIVKLYPSKREFIDARRCVGAFGKFFSSSATHSHSERLFSGFSPVVHFSDPLWERESSWNRQMFHIFPILPCCLRWARSHRFIKSSS